MHRIYATLPRDSCSLRILEDYLADEQPEVVILQETKAYYSEVGEAMDFKAHGYPYVYWNPSTGKKGYSGTAILSKVPPVAEPVFGINDPSDEVCVCVCVCV
jgi:exonuclease III